ncbi:MAG TPA: NAD-dependent epimerase/dehydratase family protein [Caulobacteraceae bacterium]|jgi:2'-hydroxyisoflavone reductase|nr:NAD-dependent epimerase/dehydratase family protein [Caulobacteraceae bacterium]
MTSTRRDVLEGTAAAAASLGLLAAAKPARPLRILILGGTGFTGPDQVRYALSRGHQVTVFNRGKQKVEWPGKVEELLGDRSTGDLKSLEGRDWDVCIDNPTTLPFWVRDAAKVLKGRVKQYVFISTISVYNSFDNPNPDETAKVAPYAGKDAFAEKAVTPENYGVLKAVSEQEAQAQFGPAVTIIRPGLIVGPGDQTDRFSYWPVRIARGGDVLAPGDGSDPVQFIDARDLAEWTIRMAETHLYGVYNATGPSRPMTMRGMLEAIEAGVNSHPNLVWVPSKFLDEHKVQPWSDMPVWVPGVGDMQGLGRQSIARAVKAGLNFRPTSVTAADTLAWFKTLPPERQAKLHAGLTPEREAEVLKAWRESAKA